MKQDKFFAQSYNDALEDYLYSCNNFRNERWDWIVITASNKRQAESYQMQIDKRLKEHRLPLGTKFSVIPDFEDKRVGSGGATLNVIRTISEQTENDDVLNKKILIINSGGDSKRIPQYSACGKIFAPVPRLLPNGYVSSIFDELIIISTDISGRCGNGIMVFPSDTEMLFNSLQLDLMSCDAAGLSIKAPVVEGKDHGVFLQGKTSHDHRNKDVARFLHKQSETLLRSSGAVDSSDQVNIDTGCIWFGEKIVRELFEMISTDGNPDDEKFRRFVNPKVCLNFYADFVYPLAYDSTLDEYYDETPENGYSDELKICRTEIWNRLHKYKLSLVKMVPARYIHFGMTHEMFDLMVNDISGYEYLGWRNRVITNAKSGTVINSVVSEDSTVHENCYIEDSIVNNCEVGYGAVLSNVDIENCRIPANVVLHSLKLNNGKYVCRIYGRNDNPKSAYTADFLKGSLASVINFTGISMDELWNKNTPSIWNACIYPECDTLKEAVDSALKLYDIIDRKVSQTDIDKWISSKKYSLANSFSEADILWSLERRDEIARKVELEIFSNNIASGMDSRLAIKLLSINNDSISKFISELSEKAAESIFPNNMRLYLACADLCRKYNQNYEQMSYPYFEDIAYGEICNLIIKSYIGKFGNNSVKKVVNKTSTVELPVRVNFCGSPSDAAPYCLEHGGTMIDAAILLNGKKPVSVTVNYIEEKEFRFGSIDQEYKSVVFDISKIRNCSDVTDPYALYKAVLVATGVVPFDFSENSSTEDLFEKIGGGLEILSSVDVPKGSGLGVSSIIAAAAVKAVNNVLAVNTTDEMIYSQVFLVEQLMNTGGGWQDQVGGYTSGIKYFTSSPGVYQKINVDYLDISDEIREELNSRFALVFSGQRRLARNVLREEMNQCIRNDESALKLMNEIQECCAIMRYYLLKGDITSFAENITKQFELVKMLDKGASNTCIEYIFEVCDDLIDGKSICGAGGGGFLQVILKKGVSKEMLKKRISETFIDCGVEVWDCELY